MNEPLDRDDLIPVRDLGLFQRLFLDREMEMDLPAVDAATAEGGTPVPLAALLKEFAIATDV